MAWASINNYISLDIITLYASAIFWTLGYDTIYGAQDINDDEIIGVKSTSIKFKENIKLFVSFNYCLVFLILIFLFLKDFGPNFFSMLFVIFIFSLVFQLIIFNKKEANSCLKAFKTNNFSGFVLFLTILSKNYSI